MCIVSQNKSLSYFPFCSPCRYAETSSLVTSPGNTARSFLINHTRLHKMRFTSEFAILFIRKRVGFKSEVKIQHLQTQENVMTHVSVKL